MSARTITVTLSDNTTDLVYYEQMANNRPGESVFVGGTLPEPLRLIFRSDIGAAGSKANDRISLKVSKGLLDDSTGQYHEASATLTLSIPRSDDFSSTHILDLCRQLACWEWGGVASGLTNLNLIRLGVVPDGDFHVDAYTC